MGWRGGCGFARLAKLGATTQLVGADAEILGDARHVLVGRVDDFLAENTRQRGLRNARAPVQLCRGQAVAVEQRFEYGGYVAFLHSVHNAAMSAQMQSSAQRADSPPVSPVKGGKVGVFALHAACRQSPCAVLVSIPRAYARAPAVLLA